ALESIPDDEFSNAMPALLAMFSKEGWLVLIWGLLFLPIGFTMQAIALLKTNSIPRWQAILFLVGILFIGTPDGVEFINLSAAILMSIAFVPYGNNLIQHNNAK
ncbi:MAG: hypothetical protein R3182_13620, partial [Draconibacterium sp.]|nr:hypothetical protein [Draconibacterium sp.]